MVARPQAERLPAGEGTGRRAASGLEWINEAWRTFLEHAGIWIACYIVAILLPLVSGLYLCAVRLRRRDAALRAGQHMALPFGGYRSSDRV